MLELLCALLFVFLGFKVLKLVFKLTWGIAKILGSLLFLLALPLLIVLLLTTGGLVLLLPLVLLAVAWLILKLIF